MNIVIDGTNNTSKKYIFVKSDVFKGTLIGVPPNHELVLVVRKIKGKK